MKEILAPDGSECAAACKPNSTLIKAVARAFRWRKMLETGVHATLADLAAAEKINPSYVSRILRLNLLAPDLVESILDNRRPISLTSVKVMKPFSHEWQKQRTLFAV